MADQKRLFKAPYDLKDVSALFAIVAFVLIIAAILGNNLFGLFQQNVNFVNVLTIAELMKEISSNSPKKVIIPKLNYYVKDN